MLLEPFLEPADALAAQLSAEVGADSDTPGEAGLSPARANRPPDAFGSVPNVLKEMRLA